jgi:serine/threonine protein kinase/tetratricopeptide (TPR) repeat protein
MTDGSEQNDNTRTFHVLTRGTMVSHYRIVEKIGAGGMGEVYLAEDTKLNRKVALKFLPSHLCQDEDCRMRFTREAQAAASLKHPNIVTIYEVSEYNGQPFFAMECCEGQPLRDVIREQTLSIEQIIDLALQIGEGLQEANEAGIIHRDIKPSNIVFDKKGRLKLADFGLASIQGDDKLTKTGSTLGTIGYMSPEQIQVKNVDHRSDLFSFGVVLYEMITGRLPFRGDNEAATLNSVLNDVPEPLPRYKSGVPDELQRMVSKLLEKDPQLRYQSAAGVISDLKLLRRDSGPVTVPPETTLNRFKRFLVPVLMVVVAVFLFVLKPWKVEIQPTDVAVAAENRLAIMYFENLADPEDKRRLGEIATNLLITDLSESRYVQVVSSQRLYDILKLLGKEGTKKVDQDVASQVATKARAKWMLMGNILQMEPQIILTAQLVEVASGNVIASQRITGEKDDKIFSLVDKLTVEIKGDLSLPTEALQEPDPQVVDISTPSAEAYRHYLDGMDNFYKYAFTEAEKSFRHAVEIDSTFAMAYFGLSLIRPGGGAPRLEAIAKAVNYLDRVNTREKHYILAQQAALNNDYAKAFQELESIIELYPDEKEAYFRLGRLYQGINDAGQAIAMFLKVVEIDPLFKEAYNVLSYVYMGDREFEKSLWAINKYIELAPNEPNPYDSRGDQYAFGGNLAGAIASYQRAIEVDPNYAGSIEKLGNMYLIKQEYAKAESLYQMMVSHPDKYARADGRTALARIQVYQGRFQQALRMLDIGIETDRMELGKSQSLADKFWQRAHVYEHLGDLKLAISDAEKSRNIMEDVDPNNILISLFKGYVPYLYAKAGNFSKSDSLVEELDRHFRESDSLWPGFYWFARGGVAFAKEDFDTASVYFEKSLEVFLPFFISELNLARCYFDTSRLGDAVTMFEKAMSRYDETRALYSADGVKAYYWLGMAYEESGWNDKAIEQYEEFLNIWKDADPGIQEIEDAKERLARLKDKS